MNFQRNMFGDDEPLAAPAPPARPPAPKATQGLLCHLGKAGEALEWEEEMQIPLPE